MGTGPKGKKLKFNKITNTKKSYLFFFYQNVAGPNTLKGKRNDVGHAQELCLFIKSK